MRKTITILVGLVPGYIDRSGKVVWQPIFGKAESHAWGN